MHHKANDGVVYAISASFKKDTIPHCLEWYKLTHSSSAAVSSTSAETESTTLGWRCVCSLQYVVYTCWDADDGSPCGLRQLKRRE